MIFKKSTWVHLRIPFSWVLAPISLFALSTQSVEHYASVFWICLIQFLLVYPASHAFNSFYDRDEESIGGLERPPKVEPELIWVAWGLDLLALLLAVGFVGTGYAGFLLAYGLASKAYSHPGLRWKARPFLGWAIVTFMQGPFTFAMVSWAIRGASFFSDVKAIEAAAISALWIGSTYPLTQVYQHREDARRGDLTLSRWLGTRGTLLFAGVGFGLAQLWLGVWALRYAEWPLFFWVQAGFLPSAVYFLRFVWNAKGKDVGFKPVMRMTWLSATGINLALLSFFVLYRVPTFAQLMTEALESRLRNLTLTEVRVRSENWGLHGGEFYFQIPGDAAWLGPLQLRSDWSGILGGSAKLTVDLLASAQSLGKVRFAGLESHVEIAINRFQFDRFSCEVKARSIREGSTLIEKPHFRIQTDQHHSEAQFGLFWGKNKAVAVSYTGTPLSGAGLSGKGPFQLVTPWMRVQATAEWSIAEGGKRLGLKLTQGRIATETPLFASTPEFQSEWEVKDGELLSETLLNVNAVAGSTSAQWGVERLRAGVRAKDHQWKSELEVVGLGDYSVRPLFHPVGIVWKGEGTFPELSGAGTLTDLIGEPIAQFQSRLNLAEPSVQIESKAEWKFPGALDLARLSEPLSPLKLTDGKMQWSLTASWNPTQLLRSEARVRVEGLSADWQGIPISGIQHVSEWSSLFPLTLKQRSGLTVSQAGSTLPVQRLSMEWEPLGKGKVGIRIKDALWAAGRLHSDLGKADLSRGAFQLRLFLKDVDLGTVLLAAESEHVSGKGTIEGEIPFDYRPEGLFISNGKIAATQAGGWIQYRAPGLSTLDSVDYLDQLEDLLAQGQQALAFKALDNFQFSRLRADIDRTPTKGLEALLKLAGKNPQLAMGQPIEFNIRVGGQLESAVKRSLLRASMDPEAFAKEWESKR
jgi:hypothetical protein